MNVTESIRQLLAKMPKGAEVSLRLNADSDLEAIVRYRDPRKRDWVGRYIVPWIESQSCRNEGILYAISCLQHKLANAINDINEAKG